jgi:hypothetical protein
MKLKLLCFAITAFSVITYAKTPNMTNSKQLVTNSNSNKFRMHPYTNPNDIQRVRLQFSSDDGLIRPLLLGFTPDNAATDGFDYGYDALNFDQFPNDMFWSIDGGNYVIQGVGAFDALKTYPLNVNITNAGSIRIALTGLENFNTEIDVFVYDSLLDTYTKINSNDFEIVLESDIYVNRFFVSFSSDDALSTTDDNALSITDNDEASVKINYLTASSEIYIKSAALMDIEKVHLINIIGQTIMSWNKKEFSNQAVEIRIPVVNIPEGTYIIKVETYNAILNKKVILK